MTHFFLSKITANITAPLFYRMMPTWCLHHADWTSFILEKQGAAVDKTGTSCSRSAWYPSRQHLVWKGILHSQLDCQWVAHPAEWWQCRWTFSSARC